MPGSARETQWQSVAGVQQSRSASVATKPEVEHGVCGSATQTVELDPRLREVNPDCHSRAEDAAVIFEPFRAME